MHKWPKDAKKLKALLYKTRMYAIMENNLSFTIYVEDTVIVKPLKASTHINCITLRLAETFPSSISVICTSSKMEA